MSVCEDSQSECRAAKVPVVGRDCRTERGSSVIASGQKGKSIRLGVLRHTVQRSRAVCERARPARVRQATPRGLAVSSNARNGVAASSPHLAADNGVRVSAPARPEHCSVQLG
ncbi:hypothetical protein NDU88_000741 [Pleurodeles waltl]|uniref:Uncharacterized protein n=1 Tax=Pleurodeles waltl TaxID=8319 RepID=A0AAV7NBD3_PLEWA|nr:hypothetical protein NDU88_000741 [Pleurodeles waltl]